MYMQSSHSASKNSGAHTSFVGVALFVVFSYQLMQRLFVNNPSGADDILDDSDEACAMEAQLFKGWNELPAESPADLEKLLEESKDTADGTANSSPSSTSAPAPMAETKKHLRTKDSQAVDASEEFKPEAMEGMLWDLAFQLGGGDTSHAAPEKMHKKMSQGVRGASKAHSKHATAAVTGKHHKPVKESLTALQAKLEKKMKASARKHAEHRALRALTAATRKTQAVTPPQDEMTAWAHNLDDLTYELQDHMKARRKARAEHAAHRAAQAAASAVGLQQEATSDHSGSELLDDIQSLGRRMCQDDEYRNSPACAQFLPADAQNSSIRQRSHQEIHDDAMAHIKLLEKHLDEIHKEEIHDAEKIRDESTAILKDLCADPARNSYPACKQFVKAAPKAASGGLRGGFLAPQHLHWDKAAASGEDDVKTLHAGVSELVLSRNDLRAKHWDGALPKVACIAVLPKGKVSEILMTYFMDNYKLQRYDGQRQLVLVYHSEDDDTARVVHNHADGSDIIAAAAMGDTEFPSATAYRYGAWMAKGADVVMRWDFDAWHHPSRMAMQVNALAASKRSASMVSRVTVFDAEGNNAKIAGGTGPHGSIAGKAAWMQKHWTPLLEEEVSMLHGLPSSHIVQVDMPELLAYHDMAAA